MLDQPRDYIKVLDFNLAWIVSQVNDYIDLPNLELSSQPIYLKHNKLKSLNRLLIKEL